MKKLFTLVCCSITLISSAQNTFESAISNPNHTEHVQKIIQLKGGSYVLLGYNGSFDIGYYMIKLDAKGTIVAQKQIESGIFAFNTGITSITATSDGGFAITGGIGDNSYPSPPFFAKFDSSLNQTVALTYYLPAVAKGISLYSPGKILQTQDSGFLIAGGTSGVIGNGYFLKIRNDGSYIANSLQVLPHNAQVANGVLDMVMAKDGNLLLLCYRSDGSSYIVKTTSPMNGSSTPIWQEGFAPVLGGDLPLQALYPTSDSGFIFTASGNYPQWVICKVNVLGNLVWSKSVNLPYTNPLVGSVVETKDGGYVFAGNYLSSFSAGNDTTISYLIKLGKDGTWQWNKTFQYRDSVTSAFFNVIPTSDSGFAAAGDIGNSNLSISDLVVYKFDSAFTTCNPLDSNTTNPITDFALYQGGGDSFQPSHVESLNIDTLALTQTTTAFSSSNPCSEILPVQLLSFNAILQNKSVNIAWKTTNEANMDHFVVERSNDARSFNGLQTVTAKGNGSVNVESYAAADLQPLQGTSYYRLREVSKDGKITYSNVVSVTVLANGIIVISPNPVHDNVHISLQSRASGQATFVVSDVTGKIVAKQNNAIAEGTNSFQIPAASLSKGMYVLKVIQNNAVQSVKFIKQ